MKKKIKTKGMVHLPGINDKQWEQFLANQKKVEKNNLWYHLP